MYLLPDQELSLAPETQTYKPVHKNGLLNTLKVMRKLILYSAASINNFIARAGGEIDWLNSPEYSIFNHQSSRFQVLQPEFFHGLP